MPDALKLSTALPGDQEINGLDALAAGLVQDTEVVDLVAALRASVEAAKRRREARESGS